MAYAYVGQPGDQPELTLADPAGRRFYSHTADLDRSRAQLFRKGIELDLRQTTVNIGD